MAARLAIGLYCALGLVALGWGIWYALTPGILGYHAEAMGGTKATLPPGVVVLYFAYRLSLGGMAAAMGLLVVGIALGPMHQGARWAALLASIAFGLGTGAIGWAAFQVESLTGAKTGWEGLPIAVALALLAFALYLGAGPAKGER